jgi:hypothetical protein
LKVERKKERKKKEIHQSCQVMCVFWPGYEHA